MNGPVESTQVVPPPVVPKPSLDPVTADLQRVDEIIRQTLAPYRSRFPDLIDRLSSYQGKRLRPTLSLLTARACGTVVDAHYIYAAAVELIHTATLVHDDVLDEAEVRRHSPTVHATWGNKTSILLGDLLFTSAFHLTSTAGDARACEIIGEATNRVCAGELLQTTERGNLWVDEAAYFEMIEGKTAALTECACRLGAEYAGADPETVTRLANYGRCLGLAFQIADDLLDLTGDEITTGKTLGTDLRQGKLTLPMIRMLARLPQAEAEHVRALIRDGGSVASYLERTGAIEEARRTAEEFATLARSELRGLEQGECRSVLEQLTRWTVKRLR